MKKIVLRITAGLVILIAALLIFASTKPDTFHVERSATINSSPEILFPLIDNFHNWNYWSPYENLDPAMKKTFSGAENGKGAVYAWEGNSKVGTGRMEILDTSIFRITIKLDFFKPFEGHNITEFILEPDREKTKVTWAMHGPNSFIGKIMHVFFSMDKMVGKDFETGLLNLKSFAEKQQYK